MKYTFDIKNPLNAMQTAATHKGFVILPPMQGNASLDKIAPVQVTEDNSLNSGGINLFGRKVVNDMYFYYLNAEVALLNATCSVDFSNNIVVTPMACGKGSVKELICQEDMQISITGYIYNDNAFDSAYPLDQVNSFYKLFRTGSNFRVSSKFLNLFDITKVVVKSMSFPLQQGGYANMQYFSIELLSDDDIPLIVK